MSKKITVSFYDACLTDYFGGHHKPVLQVPVDGNTTRKELYSSLLSELAEGVIDWEIEQNGLDYEEISQAIKDCIFWNAECDNNDILFPDLEIVVEDSDSQCYAFFIVECEDE